MAHSLGRGKAVLLAVAMASLTTTALSGAATEPPASAAAPAASGEWFAADRDRRIVDEGEKPGAVPHILLYPVNRVCDLLDLLSVQLGFGFGVHVNAHATRALQMGMGASAVSRLGFDRRRAGLCNDAKAELSLLPFTLEYFKRQNAFGAFHDYSTGRGMPYLYTRHRDYWAVGAEATVAIINIGAEVHISELPDALLGFFGIDYLRDDWPHSGSGQEKNDLSPEDAGAIQRVVIVPSRIVGERSTRMERAHGLGVYYHRFAAERFWGRIGTLFSAGRDQRLGEEFNAHLMAKGFDVHRELLERAHRILVVRRRWDVVDIDETLEAFHKHAVTKSYKGQQILRLPNYPGLLRHYRADAVLDVRLWEWGIWRNRIKSVGTMRLDCEYKLITHPANHVALDIRFVADAQEKQGMTLADFSRDQGAILVRETREAADVVSAQFADALVETERPATGAAGPARPAAGGEGHPRIARTQSHAR